ncbi:YciI family protein [Asanoa sp. WMMD1127]|uniref:YciI family protein n=1 Tax=Asanoa sp. WMMD1127 TaxID=3016107 RepID=UPI0024173AE9|nr:YciI family protein [Asanoa sp. WMMD1127]MDG4827304.1 YciI family protein [Asanoa sp. WMMD1127]
MLLIYNNPAAIEALSESERTALFADVDEIMAELTASGELIRGEALAAPAKTVRLRGGVAATTDGPFLEAKEQFAGYIAVDVASEERALDIAGRWPDARWGAMEVREIIGGAEA